MLAEHMRRACVFLTIMLIAAPACASSDQHAPATTSTTTGPSTTSVDAALGALALGLEDLPAGFTTSTQVDDTITRFCAAEDATAGLRATSRVVRGFTRSGGGASVIQLAFAFEDDGATRFVQQAEQALARCSGVPDVTGLAFDYDELAPKLRGVLADANVTSTGRHGMNVGSAALGIDIVVLATGATGQLVAVLGVDLPRDELDALALDVLRAAVGKL